MQPIFWYDKPSDGEGELELEWFDKLPTVWEVLLGKIGEFAVIARRIGEDGAITNEQGRELSIDLSFLDQEKSYIMQCYRDDVHGAASRTKVEMTTREVAASTRVHLYMVPSGGQAIHVKPKNR